jgi:hypothetical protein
MDKKKLVIQDSEELEGFEEFIEGQNGDSPFLPRGVGGGKRKNETGFEHFTFLTNDASRLYKLKDLLGSKLPFAYKFEQGRKIVKDQTTEIELLRTKLYQICDDPNSGYRKALSETFDPFFTPPKS